MLECGLCDYLKHPAGEKFCRCDFTGHVFFGETGFLLEEYPCRNQSYEEYLQRDPETVDIGSKPQEGDEEKEEKKVCRLCGDDWRLIYLMEHPLPADRVGRGSDHGPTPTGPINDTDSKDGTDD